MCMFYRTQLSAKPSSQIEGSAVTSVVKWVIPNHWPFLQILALHKILLVGLFLKLTMI